MPPSSLESCEASDHSAWVRGDRVSRSASDGLFFSCEDIGETYHS